MAFSPAQMELIQCSLSHIDSQLWMMPHCCSLCLVSPVTPFSTSLTPTPLHMGVSLQCLPKRTVPFDWPAQPPRRQKSMAFGKAESSSLCLFSRDVGFPAVPTAIVLGDPHQNPSPGIWDQPRTGLPALGLSSLIQLHNTLQKVNLILLYSPNLIPLSQASPSQQTAPTRSVGYASPPPFSR